jgi:hypothetical protein
MLADAFPSAERNDTELNQHDMPPFVCPITCSTQRMSLQNSSIQYAQ